MRVWNVFTYWSECWAAEARLRLWSSLAPDVAHVPVALVGDRTHRGDPLPGQPELPAGVEVVAVTLDADGDWEREKQQRDAVRVLLDRMGRDDLLLLCDADEIVDPRRVGAIVAATESGPVKLRMTMFACGARWRHRDPWNHPAACRTRDLPPHPSDQLRLNFGLPKVRDAGWHLTYMGTDADVDAKLKAFAHAECDTEQMRRELADVRVNGTGWVDAPLTGPLADVLGEVAPWG